MLRAGRTYLPRIVPSDKETMPLQERQASKHGRTQTEPQNDHVESTHLHEREQAYNLDHHL
jgi:hypothetical protein